VPRDTFENLNPNKKKAIFDAAVREFSTRRFSEASINKIVKDAGISRGSFYQYFENKEDLYLHVLAEIGKEKMKVAFAEPPPEDADFFAAYMYLVKTILTWAREQPVYCKIGMLMDKDDSQFIEKLKARVPEAWGELRSLIDRDKERGLIKPDVDGDLVIRMLMALNMYILQDFYQTGSEENLLRQVEDMIKIIRGGIANV